MGGELYGGQDPIAQGTMGFPIQCPVCEFAHRFTEEQAARLVIALWHAENGARVALLMGGGDGDLPHGLVCLRTWLNLAGRLST